MKVRTKIALLLFLVVGTFAAGLVAIKTHDQREFRALNTEYEGERQKSFEAFLQRWTQAMEVIARDYSCWDALVAALENNDSAWAKANLGDAALAVSRANAIWVYARDGRLFHAHNNLFSDVVAEVPLAREFFSRALDEKKLCHFFAETPLGLFEIRGATIHPSRDSNRATPHLGYLFVGHFWSREDLKDASLLTGHAVDIIPASEPAQKWDDDDRVGLVTFTRQLPGWDGRPVVNLAVRNDSAVLERLHGSSERQFLWLILFALVVFLLLVLSLHYWVNQPIRALSTCLRAQSLEPIRALENDPCEFGDFARLIRDFFQQRESLLREMAERRETESALHESEERLRHSQKMEAVGCLAGGVAHDFNNLLTAIIGYADLIANRSPNEVLREDAEQIVKAGEKAAALTRQLLAFSRKQILQPRVIDLNALILEMKKLLQRVIGEHIDLRVEAAATDGRVRADPHQIEQVILNLGVNSRDAMPAGGVLTIRASNLDTSEAIVDGTFSLPAGRYVTLTAEDTGCGMNAETRERIFEPFFTTKGPGKGTGLGLATVYGIVQQSGGAIGVRSTPGVGTTFTVYLPLETAPLDRPKGAVPRVNGSRDSETILVVEDDQTVRELVCSVLTAQGYHVLCAAHGKEALRLSSEHEGEIHLMVTDVIMPEMHGRQLAREIQITRPNIKVLFVSGYSDTEISDHGVINPDIHFLEKPFTPDVLGRKVREVLDEKRALSRA